LKVNLISIFILLLFSCQRQSNEELIDLSAYYYPLNSIQGAWVYEYEFVYSDEYDQDVTEQIGALEISRVGGKSFQIVESGNGFVHDSLMLTRTIGGIKVHDRQTVDEDSDLEKVNMPNECWNYKSHRKPMDTLWCTMILENELKVKTANIWQGYDTINWNGKSTPVINFEKQFYFTKVGSDRFVKLGRQKLVYAQNIGMVLRTRFNRYGSITEKLRRIRKS
jgi:hypothetical protein